MINNCVDLEGYVMSLWINGNFSCCTDICCTDVLPVTIGAVVNTLAHAGCPHLMVSPN